MKYLYRRIFKSQNTGSATIKELLQNMFVGELLQPGERIWIVSPWISNVVLVDNRSGSYDGLNPEWGRRELRLADLLIALMARGSSITVITKNQDSNNAFLMEFRDLLERNSLEDQATIRIRDSLHTKGILLSKSLLLGSMNLTYSGLTINDEWIEYSIDQEDVARTRLEFESYLKS